MTDRLEIPTQLDLMAYADRQLGPRLHRQVERNLARSPGLLETAQAFAMQNEAIRTAYSDVLDEPIPGHLMSILENVEPRRRFASTLRACAMALLILATGAVGWWGGKQLGVASPQDVTSFLDAVTSAESTKAWHTVSASTVAGAVQPLEWLSERVALELQAPSLISQGYRLIGKALVDVAGRPTVRLTYQRDNGNTVRLFMRTRWPDTPPAITLDTNSDVAAAYWFDGPMMWVLTGDVETDALAALAKAIDGTLRLQPSPAEAGPAQNTLDLNTPNAAAATIPQ